MRNTLAISPSFGETILHKLDRLEKVITRLVQLVEEVKEPPYSSEAWWEWSEKKALEDYRRGRYTIIKNKEELEEFFKDK